MIRRITKIAYRNILRVVPVFGSASRATRPEIPVTENKGIKRTNTILATLQENNKTPTYCAAL